MAKPKRKVNTDERSIKNAEEKLDIRYTPLLREKLKKRNGFSWGYFGFTCVYDDEDKYHTFDDVVRANTNKSAGWRLNLPDGYVGIAEDNGLCLALSTKKDGKVYRYQFNADELTVFAENDEELAEKLEAQEKEIKKLYKK